jgi:hypothetical protein
MLNFAQRQRIVKGMRMRGHLPFQKSEKKPNPPILRIYEQFIEGTGKAQQRGRYLLVNCFYHNERNASMALYSDNNTFYCFACQKSGTSYNILMDKLNLTFPEAVKYCEENGLYV